MLVSEAGAVMACGFDSHHPYQVINAIVVEWYTHWPKKPMPQGLRVQVSPIAPNVVAGSNPAVVLRDGMMELW